MSERLWRRWADEWFDTILPAEADAKARYLRLAAVTERYLRCRGQDTFDMELLDPGTAGNHLGWRFEVSETVPCPRLSALWWVWDQEVNRLLQRYPHLDLREALADVSEGTRGASWPYGYEQAIREWIASGDYAAMPRGLVVARDLFDRFVDLHQRAGGWWFWDKVAERKVWKPDAGGVEDTLERDITAGIYRPAGALFQRMKALVGDARVDLDAPLPDDEETP